MFQFRTLIWAVLITLCFACKDKDDDMYLEPAIPTPTATTLTYLALGDSYTIGESVPVDNRWTYYLADLLRQSGVQIDNPVTIARTGWTTSELQEAIRQSNVTKTYDLVTLLIGVNNQYRGQSEETYRQEFRELLNSAVKFAADQPSRVLVLSIPDWGVTPFARERDQKYITKEIDAFNAVAKEECKQADITFVDITPISQKLGTDASYIAEDSLHFSGKMYSEWARLALPAAKAVFRK